MGKRPGQQCNSLPWVVLLAASIGTGYAATALSPSAASVNAGKTCQFTLSVPSSLTPSTANIQWSVWPRVGTISNTGLYTAPASLSAVQSAQLVVLIVPSSPTLSPVVVTSKLQISPPVSVGVTPQTASLSGSGTVQLTAKVTNNSNTAVSWTVSPAVGTVSSSGLYRAPSTISSSTTVIVKATSLAEGSQSGSAKIALTPPTTRHNTNGK